MLRYKRHHFTAHGVSSPKIGEEFMAHAIAESEHADRLAQRIVQLGGEPDFSPDTLTCRSHAEYVAGASLSDMIRENLVAERIAMDSYRELIQYLDKADPTTGKLIKEILAVEEQHADELADFLVDVPA